RGAAACPGCAAQAAARGKSRRQRQGRRAGRSISWPQDVVTKCRSVVARMRMQGWIDVGPADLIEGELRGLEVGERLVLLARYQGRITAMDDSCNHAGSLLSGGWMPEKKGAGDCPLQEHA